MIPYIKKILFLLFVAGAFHGHLAAQEKIQVVTRTVTKIVNQSDITGITIKAEKATIRIGKSNNNQVKIKILLVSKNPSRRTAEEDLKYCDYNIKNRSKVLFLSNSFQPKDSYKQIASNLSALYDIEVPDNLTLNISNIYGDLTIEGIKGTQSITVNFGQVYLNEISGSLNIRSWFTDISGEVLNGPIKIDAQNAGIKLSQINDILNINSHFGEISLTDLNASVYINGDMTKVNLAVDNTENYTFRLTSLKDKIILPATLTKNLVKKSGANSFQYGSGKFLINITTSYNSITVK